MSNPEQNPIIPELSSEVKNPILKHPFFELLAAIGVGVAIYEAKKHFKKGDKIESPPPEDNPIIRKATRRTRRS